MSPTQWAELGIAPTDDERAIKRAYALRLKGLNVEADPAGFQRLRAAFETALRSVRPARRQPVPEAPPRLTALPEDAADEAGGEIRRLLAGGDVAGALAAMAVAEAGGRLSFGEAEELQLAFLLRAADPAPLSAEQLGLLAGRFEWRQALHPLRRREPAAFASVDARIDAELWFGELRKTAARRSGRRRRDRAIARVLLRGQPAWRDRLFGATAIGADRAALRGALATELALFDRHAPWVGDRFDPARIAWCRRRIRQRRWVTLLLLAPFTLLLLLPLMTEPSPSAAVAAAVWLSLLALPFAVRWLRRRRARR